MAYIVFSSLHPSRSNSFCKWHRFEIELKLMSFNCGDFCFGSWISKRIHFQLFHQFHLVNFCIWCLFNRFGTESNFLASHKKEMRYFSYPSMFAFFVTQNIRSPSHQNCLANAFYMFPSSWPAEKGLWLVRIHHYRLKCKPVIHNNNDKINRHWTTPFWLMPNN